MHQQRHIKPEGSCAIIKKWSRSRWKYRVWVRGKKQFG